MDRVLETRRLKPDEGVKSADLLVEDVRVNYRAVDPRFIQNTHLPVDPKIAENKRIEYETDILKWSEIDA